MQVDDDRPRRSRRREIEMAIVLDCSDDVAVSLVSVLRALMGLCCGDSWGIVVWPMCDLYEQQYQNWRVEWESWVNASKSA